MNKHTLLITCEHAGRLVPEEYRSLFSNAVEDLDSHKGWDPGAWEIALSLGSVLNTEPVGVHYSRLLIESNRSLSHPKLFSMYTNKLSLTEKNKLITEYYLPYRNQIEERIQTFQKPVLHLSIHTFTPIWNERERQVDIGLLFDPERTKESLFCTTLKRAIDSQRNGFLCRLNEPYLGTDDGFTTYLRTRFDDADYLGIEIEINQKFNTNLSPVKEILISSLTKAIQLR